ncbi:MAG: molybdopterin molybdotransferase MoeA [Ignavibacteriales bacterium]|nr:molybdopterin molybdotransferase MoeA [Ignavibacteriales bacterium]
MVRTSEARQIIVRSLHAGPQESCALSESYGRILATEVTAPLDVPGFDNSSMDGYAVRSDEIRSAGENSAVDLVLQDEIPAGEVPKTALNPKSAIRIMTGAPIPPGADAVVEQELADAKNGTVRVRGFVQAGRNIRLRGDDIRAGSVVLKKGRRLTPARVGVLASLGIERVDVFRKPKVALLTTGNELVDPSSLPGPGQIRNSNAVTLSGLIRESGCEVIDLGIARDDPEELGVRIRQGLKEDALITSGGVSVGRHDYVLRVLKAQGVEIKFWKVNMKPGMPFAFGILEGNSGRHVPVFALPGNAVSSIVTFLQLARYGLERLRGNEEATPLTLKAVLVEEIVKRDGKHHYVRGVARNENGTLIVQTTGSQSSALLTSLSMANCLIHVPEESRTLPKGSTVDIELI